MKTCSMRIKLVILLCLTTLVSISAPASAGALPSEIAEETLIESSSDSDWYMAGANPQRTSWVSEEVGGRLYVEWYRPIEAYIDQKVQVIAAYDQLYLSTARGLYVLRADNGEVVWRYDTELPLGHSPTVVNRKVYVGGYDKKLHALNAFDGTKVWEFTGAGAGFSVNPLVAQGNVYAGNRDGYFYAVNAETGEPVWQYPAAGQPPLGPIKFSAAYADGIIYFVSTDMHAYALNASDGSLVWQSNKLPGESFQSWWPVVYRDKVVFSSSQSYRIAEPGVRSIPNPSGGVYGDYVNGVERDDIFPPESNPQKKETIGPTFVANNQNGPWDWVDGTTVMDASRIAQYFEDDGVVNLDRRTNKPWRRTYFVLNRDNGSEFTFDSDRDGHPEYAPVLYYGSKNGSAYPPIVMPDGVIYQNNHHEFRGWISGGQVTGWKVGTTYLSLIGGASAVDEPQALSGGGNIIYRNLCCDRVGGAVVDVTKPGIKGKSYWDYNKKLEDIAPGYDSMWVIHPGLPRVSGSYRGKHGSVNGIYHNHGDQNPLIPHNGRVFTHRSNAIIALGPKDEAKQQPLLEINPTQDRVAVPDMAELTKRLEHEVTKMIQAGRLRPGYHNDGTPIYSQLSDYFSNPGDTLYTLTRAYPHLSPEVQAQLRIYLQEEYNIYFADTMSGKIGWAVGGQREYMTLPPEVAQAAQESTTTEWPGHNWPWKYPQHNFYALWKYAEIFPESATEIYEKAKGKLQVPAGIDDSRFADFPWEHHTFIVGYIGFLKLQELTGATQQDSATRIAVEQELNRLLGLRVSQFQKDTRWGPTREDNKAIHRRRFNVAANFLWLVPEFSDYLRVHAFDKVQEAVDEYNYVGPFWFVASTENTANESVRQHLYDYVALFQAKAQILQQSQGGLYKYLDVPAFKTGDLFYIQNLVAVLEADPRPLTAAPIVAPNGGIFKDAVTITLTSPSGAPIYYTLDGSEPTTSSSRYTEPLIVSDSVTVKAVAHLEEHRSSYVITRVFIVSDNLFFLPLLHGNNGS
jgi:hypothetical protein